MTNKELNRLVEQHIYRNDAIYDVRHEFKVIRANVSLQEAMDYIHDQSITGEGQYTVTSSNDIPNYSENLVLAIKAAEKLVHQETLHNEMDLMRGRDERQGFMLQYFNDEQWTATIGNTYTFCEHSDSNPAYAICMAILKYTRKLET